MHHVLVKIVAPAGMNQPLYTTSSVNQWGIPETSSRQLMDDGGIAKGVY